MDAPEGYFFRVTPASFYKEGVRVQLRRKLLVGSVEVDMTIALPEDASTPEGAVEYAKRRLLGRLIPPERRARTYFAQQMGDSR